MSRRERRIAVLLSAVVVLAGALAVRPAASQSVGSPAGSASLDQEWARAKTMADAAKKAEEAAKEKRKEDREAARGAQQRSEWAASGDRRLRQSFDALLARNGISKARVIESGESQTRIPADPCNVSCVLAGMGQYDMPWNELILQKMTPTRICRLRVWMAALVSANGCGNDFRCNLGWASAQGYDGPDYLRMTSECLPRASN